jgi:rhamnosyltransferase subunit B
VARLLFTSLGSLGDLYPMLPVAERLRDRGHEIEFAIPSHLEAAVRAEGFDCTPIPIPQSAGMSEDRSIAAIKARINERFPALLAGALEALRSASASADMLVTHQYQVAAAITAREARIPWVTLSVFPGFIPSSYTVPQPHWLPALPTPAGRMVNRLTWGAFQLGLRHLTGSVIDAALINEGLGEDDSVFTPGGLSPYLTLVLSSPRYSPRLPDWPDSVRLTGYSHWDEPRSWQSPPGLEEFLARAGSPALLMTSSAPERDPVSFFKVAAAALAAAGLHGLALLGGAFDQFGVAPGDEIAPGVTAWPYAPLSRVVERCSVVIHHAGFGTTLTTLRHGRPSIGIPATFDQWYHAARIKALRIGRAVEWRRCTTERLRAEIETVLADPAYARRAAELGAFIAQEDGAGRAADELEALLRQA